MVLRLNVYVYHRSGTLKIICRKKFRGVKFSQFIRSANPFNGGQTPATFLAFSLLPGIERASWP